jgi:membrane-bound serine protease (ClpP class)
LWRRRGSADPTAPTHISWGEETYVRSLALALLALAALAYAEAAVAVYLDGAIDGTAVSLVQKALADAEARGAPLVVVLNTYGGYLAPMDKIVEMLINAKTPVYAYVPPGAKAVSAGAFIAMAAPKIYMAPTAQIGAAEPRPPDPKVVNYAAARMRSLAEAKWNDSRVDVAVSFVTQNRVLTGREAIELGIAEPPPQWTFLAEHRRDPLAQLINALSDPTILIALMALGAVLIAYELFIAGFQGAGVLGGVLIALALYLLGQLGAEWLWAALALGGAALIAAEMLTGHGALALTGTVLLAAALYMAAAGQPYNQTQAAAYAAAGIMATAAVALAYLGYKVRQALRRRPQDYTTQLIGAVGVAKTPISPGKPGVVYAAGEEWTAEADEEIPQGAKVIITAIEGLTLKVKKHQQPS